MKKKIPSLSDKELNKFIEVLGKYKVEMLWVESKIKLTIQQLNYLNDLRKDDCDE